MIEFRPAVRERVPLLLAIAGPSKSGKSYSASRLAAGMAPATDVFVINTEGARGHMYADKFPFRIYDLEEPYSMDRYRAAIVGAKDKGAKALIIDSLSHAHEGVGGLLDWHERELDRMAGQDWAKRERMTWAAWVKPKAEEAKLIGAMLSVSFPIIACIRAKEKLKITKGRDPEDLGWQPICSDRFSYETIATLLLPPGSNGVPDLKANATGLREPLASLIRGEQISEALGARLLAWANSPSAPDRPAEPPPPDVKLISVDQQTVLLDECRVAGLVLEDLKRAAKVRALAEIAAADYERARAWITAAAAKKKGS